MGKNLVIIFLVLTNLLLLLADRIGFRLFSGNWSDSKLQTVASVFSSFFSMAAVIAAVTTIILNENRTRGLEIQQQRAIFNRLACWIFLRRIGNNPGDTALFLCIDNLTSYPVSRWNFVLKTNPEIAIGSAQEGLLSPGKHEFILIPQNANNGELLKEFYLEFTDVTGSTWRYSSSHPIRLVKNEA